MEIIVCPKCHYGFLGNEKVDDQKCPRVECGHAWESLTQSVEAVHGVAFRRAIAEVVVVAGASPLRVVLPDGESIIGRDSTCRVALDNHSVSRIHAKLTVANTQAWIQDLGSAYGTSLNGQFVNGRIEVNPRDELAIGGTTLRFEIRFEAAAADALADSEAVIKRGASTEAVFRGRETGVIPLDQDRLTFGSRTDRDVVLPHLMVSGRHAVLERVRDEHFLHDTQSYSGTFVNGRAIIRAKLISGDRVQFGPFLFRYEGNRLVRTQPATSIGVVARGLTTIVGSTILLDDLTFEFKAGEFVGLLGPSGAGKTTLLDALNGMRPATTGEVYLNQTPLYEESESLRQHIGYVPQEDIIHRELTVRQALCHAARLRLPSDLGQEEFDRIITETLETLDLVNRADVRIRQLSGGQRKRVSVGVELLSKPGVIFLDEPTSGLDPGTESKLMRVFRRLADQGRTVVCTTHVMENIDLFHRVVVLAPGGKLAYFGSPLEAKQYFGIQKITLLYDRMEQKSAVEWRNQFQASQHYREQVAPIIDRFSPAASKPRSSPLTTRPVSILRQSVTLTHRFLDLLLADKANLGLLFAQPLVITTLICVVCQSLPTILFLLVISALWFGCSGAAQQIVKERPIYRRERMVNLRLDSYLISKSLPLMILTAMQSTLMLGVVWLLEDFTGSLIWLFVSLLLAAWNGVGIGLLISAASSNADKSMSVVPLTLIPQIVLAGVLVPLPEMNALTKIASHCIAAKWANQACEISLMQDHRIDQELLADEDLARPLRNLFSEYDLKTPEGRLAFQQEFENQSVNKQPQFYTAIVVLSGMYALFLMATVLVLKRQDSA